MTNIKQGTNETTIYRISKRGEIIGVTHTLSNYFKNYFISIVEQCKPILVEIYSLQIPDRPKRAVLIPHTVVDLF